MIRMFFFLIQIQINTSLKRQLALDSFRVLNLSECGGLTYSLKPCTHADSLSRFFSKRKSGGNWQMSERLAIVCHDVHFLWEAFWVNTVGYCFYCLWEGPRRPWWIKRVRKKEREKEKKEKERVRIFFPCSNPSVFFISSSRKHFVTWSSLVWFGF